MPTLKARIFSNDPEQASGLIRQLTQEGYQVEVAFPDQVPSTPADLEIYVEACSEADAIRRAAELAADLNSDVAVASGALVPSPPPLAAPVSTKNATEVKPPTEPVPSSVMTVRNSVSGFWQRVIPATAVTLAAWSAAAREAAANARDAVREYRERAQFRSARARARREEHLIELLHQRTEAEERASQLRADRENAAALLQQMEDENEGFLEPPGQEPPPKVAEVSLPRRLQRFVERARALRWEAVLAGVASAGAVFAIGLAVASFNSKSAVSTDGERSAAAPSVTSTPQTAPAAATKPVARPSPAVRAAAPKPSPAPRRRVRHENAAAADDAITNDVTVRHYAKPTPTPRTQAQGWKHFSDIDH